MFTILKSSIDYNPFDILKTTNFEKITNGRYAAILVEPLKYNNTNSYLIPIVRSTTIYKNKAIKFAQIHKDIIAGLDCKFNNAMIENYNDNYKTMKYHSDQSLDLVDNSYICIYSCYKNSNIPNRELIIRNKDSNEISKISMNNNQLILFSLDANNKFMHKVVLIEDKKYKNNEWIGITYRLSKTFIDPYKPHIYVANDKERHDFYKFKNIENTVNKNDKVIDITYTISPSDLLPLFVD